MDKLTQVLIVFVITLTVVGALTFIDTQTPVATAKFHVSGSVTVRISVYDSENGFFKSFIEKLKVFVENVKQFR